MAMHGVGVTNICPGFVRSRMTEVCPSYLNMNSARWLFCGDKLHLLGLVTMLNCNFQGMVRDINQLHDDALMPTEDAANIIMEGIACDAPNIIFPFAVYAFFPICTSRAYIPIFAHLVWYFAQVVGTFFRVRLLMYC